MFISKDKMCIITCAPLMILLRYCFCFYRSLETVETAVNAIDFDGRYYANLTLLKLRERPRKAAAISEASWNRDILDFNVFLNQEREEVFNNWPSSRPSDDELGVIHDVNYADERKGNYFQVIARDPDVMTYVMYTNRYLDTSSAKLERPLGDRPNLPSLPRPCYVGTMDTRTCEWYLKNKAQDERRLEYDTLATCEKRSSLETSLLRFTDPEAKAFQDEFDHFRGRFERVFMHVIPHGRVSRYSARVGHGNLVIAPASFLKETVYIPYDNITFTNWNAPNLTHVDEVFVANHHGAFFHWTVEALSRTALYLRFLRDNPSVKIVLQDRGVMQKVEYLEALGIDASRVVVGYVTARVVYLPQGPACTASVPPLGMNMLSEYFLSYIHTYIRPARAPKDSILLIHRVTKRHLAQHEEISEYLLEKAKLNNMELAIFSDRDLPKLSTTMEMFHRAALIVGPHGAGLVNLLFSRNPTVVIEIVKDDGSSTFSYFNMCRNLGHVYHSIRSEKSSNDTDTGGMFIDLKTFRYAVEFYFENFIIPNKRSEFT